MGVPGVIRLALVVCLPLFAAAGTSRAAGALAPPDTPVITEPSTDGQIVNPSDVHMEAWSYHDPDGDAHASSDVEIWKVGTAEKIWQALTVTGIEKNHLHLGDGTFIGSYTGRLDLEHDVDYRLQFRFRDTTGEVSPFALRLFRTSAAGPPGVAGDVPYSAASGFTVDVVAGGFELPVNIAFVPNPGPNSTDPFFYVTELYGTIKVVFRDGTVGTYAGASALGASLNPASLLNFNPTGAFPGSGEQGLAGITVDPATGDVYVGVLYASPAPDGPHYPKILKLTSTNGGRTASTITTILQMPGETQGQSHFISNFTIGPDGKLYVHCGDGFDYTTAQNLDSFRGKILRMNLNGTPATDNPFYNAADGISARDYVWAYGLRNPFGGAWRASDNSHYEIENGPNVDRFAKVVTGRNFGWDDTDASMSNFAIYNWSPAHGPVNVQFVQPSTFSGSGFPFAKMDHAFATESGPTYASGPQAMGKRIVEFELDGSGNRISGPTTLVEYVGTGRGSCVGLATGPDGLYFTELYKDQNATSAVQAGARVFRVRWIGINPSSGTGLTGTYFNAVDLTNPVLTRIDPAINFTWPGSPAAGVNVDNFSVRWTGSVIAPSSDAYTFTTNSDDGVRLWINGQLLIDNWTNHSATENSGSIVLQAGQAYDLKMEFFDGVADAVAQLYWATSSMLKQIIPQDRLLPTAATPPSQVAAPVCSPAGGSYSGSVNVAISSATSGATIRYMTDGTAPTSSVGTIYSGPIPVSTTTTLKAIAYKSGITDSTVTTENYTILPPGSGTGLSGSYYSGLNFNTLVTTRIDPTVDFQWGTGAPAPGMPINQFSVRWTGKVLPIFTETYTFYTVSDDGVRLRVNGQLLIDKWVDQGGTEWSGTIALTGGQPVDIVLEYYDNNVDATARLFWSSPSQAKQIIPQSQLFPPGGAPPPAVAAPTFSPVAGTYTSAQSVTISTTTAGSSIRYTTDGSTPTSSSGTVYSVPVSIPATATLKAIAYQTGMTDSTVTTGTYTISPPGTGTGLSGDYYSGLNFNTLVTTRIDPTVDFQWGTGAPAPGMPINQFSVRWTGKVQPQFTETYRFYTVTDDGVRLRVNGQLLVDKWVDQGGTEWSGTIALTAGQQYDIVMEYYDNNVDATARLFWSSPSQAKQIIPQNRLFPPGGAPPPTVAAPTFAPGGGTYTSAQSVTISSTTSGASIRYTTDGSTPTSTVGTLYSGPVSIASTTTLKAIAFMSGMTDSSVTSATYTINLPVANPTFNPGGGTYTSAQSVAITTTTSGASIRYTTDGSTPTSTTGTLYSSPVSIGTTTTLKAIAYKSGMTDSAVTSATYTINLPPSVVANPTFNPAGGTYTSAQSVAITTSTSGASIRYTTDGSTPTSSSGTLYSSPVSIGATTTLKAIAYKSGMTDSGVTSATYTINLPVANPTFNPGGGTYTSAQSVTITTSTAGASIRYTTDGSTPTSSTGTLYSSPVSIGTTTTLKAIAYKSGMTDSGVTSATYTINLPVANPTFNPGGGTYTSAQSVAITTSTSGASIRYTTDGSTPTSSTGTLYSSPVSIGTTTTLKAIAYKSGMTDSGVTSATYTINLPVANPTFSPVAGTYTSAQSVTITTSTAGASIRYTTDGSTPTSSVGTPYSAPVSISATTTLKAIAYKSGMTDSGVTTGIYTISPPGTGSGLSGDYYTGDNFTTYVLTRIDPTVDFQWGTGAPAPGMPSNHFSIRWTGKVQPQFTETYRFYTVTDDGVRLRVNGQLLVDKWVDQGATEWSGTIALTAGQQYDIVMEYYDKTVDATARLFWSSPSQAKQIIPQSRLFPPGPPPAAAPVFSPVGGTYSSAQSVTITTATSGASINYTTDGSTPTSTVGTPYTAPVSISATTTLKAVAYKSGMSDSVVTSATYTLVAPGTGTGLSGDYYSGINFNTLVTTRIDSTVDFQWGQNAPAPGLPTDQFSVRWTGKVQPQFTETYTFYTVTDDGVRLRVNGQLLIDKWVDQSSTEWSGTIALTGGVKYDIVLEFYENTWDATARLFWSSPTQSKQIIPMDQLFPPGVSAKAETQSQTASDQIQGFLNAALPGETVTLGAGSIDVPSGLVLNPGVSLRGAGPGKTILVGKSSAAVLRVLGTPGDGPVTIEGLTLTGGAMGLDTGAADAHLRHLVVVKNGGDGVVGGPGGSIDAVHLTVADNGGHGVSFFGSAGLRNSIVSGNGGFGVSALNGAAVSYSDFFGNVLGSGTAGVQSVPVAYLDPATLDYRVPEGAATSDAGDPFDPFDAEPEPNGNRADQGAFGNTGEAPISRKAGSSSGGGGGCGATGLEALLLLALLRLKKKPPALRPGVSKSPSV